MLLNQLIPPLAKTLAQYKHTNLVFLHPIPSSGVFLQWSHAKYILPLLTLDMKIKGWDDWVVEGSLLEILSSYDEILKTYIKPN